MGHLDWIAFSVDASTDELHSSLGRGDIQEVGRRGSPPNGHEPAGGGSLHLQRVKPLWRAARELGFRLKLNTVVARQNIDDDMGPLVAELLPERWKVFQVRLAMGQQKLIHLISFWSQRETLLFTEH